MHAMKARAIPRFEMLARQMVEGSFGRLFGGRLEPLEVAVRLARTMEENELDGRLPRGYQVLLNAQDLQAMTEQNPDLAGELSDHAWRLSRRTGLTFSEAPSIELLAGEEVRRGDVRVTVLQQAAGQHHTTQVLLRPNGESDIVERLADLDAFLIVDGGRHAALDKPVIDIGRSNENDIILSSPAVSRRHAQIRWRLGRFVLYDLSQRGRTMINGAVVNERMLRSGDVIALSDVMLVYGEGNEDLSRRSRSITGDEGDELTLPGPHA